MQTSHCFINAYQWSAKKEPYILNLVGPKQVTLDFLTDTGTQISILNKQAKELRIKPSRKSTKITGIMGTAEKCPTAQT